MKQLADGIHVDVDRDDYDRVQRVNFSTLKVLGAKSPKHYHHALITPPEDTDPKKLGRAVHIAALEPERFRSVVAVWKPKNPKTPRRGEEWDAFKEQNEGRELLTEREHEVCQALQAAVQGCPAAVRYLRDGRGEVTITWTYRAGAGVNAYALPCKGRVDFIAPTALVDLKTTKNASPEGFGREVLTYRYDTQAAWYVDGYERASGKRLPYVIIAVEKEPPHDVVVYRVPEVILERGREEYRGWMDQLAHCRATNRWPGYAEEERELELPAWAWRDDDEDLSDSGLKLGGVAVGE